jgi:succinyl-diaminopimelate desuccinylase
MDALKTKVLKRIEGSRDEAIELLADLVKAESVNPPGDTRKTVEVIKRTAATFTENVEVVSLEETVPNVFVTLNPGARPQLLYNGHLDTVPVGNEANWEMDPLGAVIKENAMYGRGVADMKGGVAAMLMAAKAIAVEKVPLKGSLVLSFVGDEETGGMKGAGYLMEKGHYSPDMVVVGEITNDSGIAIAEKGIAVYALTTKGKTAHGSTPWVGVNAIDKMVKILHRIQTRLVPALSRRESGFLPPATMNIGTIQGGVSFNVVADACEVVIDRRTLPGETAQGVTQEIQDVIDEVKKEDPEVDVSLVPLAAAAPFETSPDETVCRLAQVTMKELGRPTDFVGYEQVCDGRFFSEKGIPTIIIGPGIAKKAHTPNENLELNQYLDAIKVYALLAMNAVGE